MMIACALTSHQGSIINFRKLSIFSFISSSDATATSVKSCAIIFAPLTRVLGTAFVNDENP